MEPTSGPVLIACCADVTAQAEMEINTVSRRALGRAQGDTRPESLGRWRDGIATIRFPFIYQPSFGGIHLHRSLPAKTKAVHESRPPWVTPISYSGHSMLATVKR